MRERSLQWPGKRPGVGFLCMLPAAHPHRSGLCIMTIHTSRPALGRAIAVFVGLFSALLAGCSLGNSAGVIQRDPNQVFVYPNTVFDRVFPASKTELGLSLDPAFAGEIYSQTVIDMTQVQLVT